MASYPPQEEQAFGGVAQTFQSAVSPTFLSAAFDAFDQPLTGHGRATDAGWKACVTADWKVCATLKLRMNANGRQWTLIRAHLRALAVSWVALWCRPARFGFQASGFGFAPRRSNLEQA